MVKVQFLLLSDRILHMRGRNFSSLRTISRIVL